MVEFYEDYYEENPDAAMEVPVDGDVQFVTGDEEYDEIERRLADDDLSDEELEAMLDTWDGHDTPAPSEEDSKAGRIEKLEELAEDELGEGFEDSYGA